MGIAPKFWDMNNEITAMPIRPTRAIARNISVFHYRNNGADYGRIVVGMQVPPDEMEEWQAFLDTLGYRY